MKTGIISYYSTQFGELWEQSLFDLVEEAIRGVIKSAKLDMGHIDAIFFGNMLGGILENNLHTNAKIAEMLGVHIPIFRVEAACASGGMAFHLANNYIQSGKSKTVLVVGAEKMNDVSPEDITQGLMSAASGQEQGCGLTFPGLYALMARAYLSKYHYTKQHLAAISVKNHAHAMCNPSAQFHKRVTEEMVMSSPMVADPLGVLDSSPISDGAAALIISSDKTVLKKANVVSILSSEVATDSISLMKRRSITEIEATQIAAKKAFTKAKLSPSNIQVAELHDCFTIAELMAMEDIGFWGRGEAGRRAKEYETLFENGGDLITNTSGGLKAAGHPVGATGIKQLGELYLQLTRQAKGRQVQKARFGLAHNVGGSGGTAVITIVGI